MQINDLIKLLEKYDEEIYIYVKDEWGGLDASF